MKKEIIDWLFNIEKIDGIPPNSLIAFNLGLIESEQGFMIYFVGAFEYSEDDDDWACIEPPTKPYRYLKLPDKVQKESWESVLELCKNTLTELENEGSLNKTLIKNAKAITTGFDEGELIKIR
ncbi:hypothetical protein [Algibacter lectus]|uniref:Uncharacterized protein n=1 Tax=Algibacter lectus TaxID=221126 RepID=A0A4R8MEE1_9FLAO|nr:hypothetical protein [Algibacter lectus]MWW26885.1 hypothetical protein [Algibacter lectus]TDY63358.1 hypothetical protein DFQ06_0233 [Algibacter lectus]